MNKLLFTFIFLFSCTIFGQKILKLKNEEKFDEIIKLENESSNLSGEELYYMGYAFFMKENDVKAIEYYDKALTKKFDNPIVYFQKGYSQMFLKQYDKALENINVAIEKAPLAEFYVEKANIFKYQKDDVNEDRTYEQGLKNADKEGKWYLTLAKNAGNFYYASKKDYKKSEEIYRNAVILFPEEYILYEKLIKSLNASNKFTEANEVFEKVKTFYNQKVLSEDYMKFKNMAVDEFAWKDQYINVFKSFEKPKNTLESLYKVYLIDKSGEKIERKFNIEKTIKVEKTDPEYVICEETKDGHSTYPIGFKDDSFTLSTLRELVTDVLNKEVNPAASIKVNK
ncbi:tetratricopeptide repeat protein [Chryseobacterium caseinilyticum]|uniref:Tetratricopeptide repeat protein n=1 Tax=Chryseobacterium caseinilyticum TaxID=2771428 RepID=A0ABR8ZD04_9FLAO|nr:hypothetical protein [Chryseobacterium caseinilyticum]MBD8083148.1 hypothetical protein [Chryseobacterium caseinilyticum]